MNAHLSPATVRELRCPAPAGSRHAQIVRLAAALVRAGFSSEATFAMLRPNYDPHTLPDTEIISAIKWAQRAGRNTPPRRYERAPVRKAAEKISPLVRVKKFLGDFTFSEADLFHASPIRLPDNFKNDFRILLENLFSPTEKINVVSSYREESGTDNQIKARPFGMGISKSRNEWLKFLSDNSAPNSKAGAWIRLNPVNGTGISDSDITAFPYALLESDCLPFEFQISVLAKLPLPISAIISSGGKSIHAWVKIAAENTNAFREKAAKLFSLLSPFGFDSSNRNPSRLGRLPGVIRTIGAYGDGRQRLLYLNSNPTERSIA